MNLIQKYKNWKSERDNKLLIEIMALRYKIYKSICLDIISKSMHCGDCKYFNPLCQVKNDDNKIIMRGDCTHIERVDVEDIWIASNTFCNIPYVFTSDYKEVKKSMKITKKQGD